MEFIDDTIRQAQAAVEQKFLFRKIGLPFDYASDPDDFPSKSFATAKEARANLPNPAGLGGGYFYSCRNHSLLFDAYLMRVELGIEGQGDDAILDRLIGGLIRLDTIAPKAFLVGGLSPDGRGFYAQPRRENHAAWAFALSRGLDTAAIAQDSQDKFRSIAGKWIDRVKREKFRLLTVDGKPAAEGDLSVAEPLYGPVALAMLLVAARSSRDEKDYETYAAMAEEEGRARLGKPPKTEVQEDMQALMWRQAALSLVARHDPEPERIALAKERLRENAQAAMRRIVSWREYDPSFAGEEISFDWRTFPAAPVAESPYGFTPPDSWLRLENEESLTTALLAMYVMLLAGDRELVEPHVAEIEECLATTPWSTLVTLGAIAPAIGVHARGVDMDLWDKTLYETHREAPSSEISFAAKYLEPDYDDENPEKCGHQEAPPGKKGAEQPTAPAKQEGGGGGGGKKRRRRRRK